MPPKKKRASTQSSRKTRNATRQSRRNGNDVPDIYSEMLAEAAHAEANELKLNPRSAKRRKIEEEPNNEPDAADETVSPPHEVEVKAEELPRPQQVVYDEFEGSDESDVEFEDVDLEAAIYEPTAEDEMPEQKSLQIDLSKPISTTPRKPILKRKPVTKAEREFRLDVHKWHILSLMLHGLTRNQWCDDEVVHVTLKQLVPKKVISLLHVDESAPAYQRNHSFMKGIEEVCTIWRSVWTITTRGMRRSYWRERVDAQEEFDDAEDPIDLEDFREAARSREGSRDLGAQLFTALLRALALEARLVFSPQVLPFSGVAKGQTPEKPKPVYLDAPSQSYGSSTVVTGKRKKIRDSPYPIFWTEVLGPTTSAWIPLDPLVRNSINKPKTQFEPPALDPFNQMTYVLAFEDDGTVHDVSRRYSQWFNAKTRKLRVESTKGGMEWWKKALRVFRRHLRLPRDTIENEYLAQRAAAEGMPKNVQDFKNHPVYVLERHLRSTEVLHPRREVGKFTTGVGKHARVESVYRAQDVFACRTADAWYRRGRDVRIGEQPLKRVIPKIKRAELLDDEDDEEEPEGVALYAEFQTQVYQPPPVQHARIPKNAYGNLDIYVSSMIPAGAVHINHPLAAQAAKILQIDYAEAVTGFVFKSRQGTAVVSGAVVAAEFTAAMIATVEGLEWQGTQEVQAARTKIILGIWKRMLMALRIHQKIEADYGQHSDDSEAEDREDEDEHDDEDPTYADDQVGEVGGGFMIEAEKTEEKVDDQNVHFKAMKGNFPVVLPDEVVQQPIKVTISPHTANQYDKSDNMPKETHNFQTQTSEDGDIFGDNDDTEVRMRDDRSNDEKFTNETTNGGGFVSDHTEFEGGGFMIEDETTDQQVATNTRYEPIPDRKDSKTAIEPSPDLTSAPSNHDIPSPSPEKQTRITGQVDGSPPEIEESSITQSSGTNVDAKIEPLALKNGGDKEDDGHRSDGSLMSHDPDEDDDEPEWLEDAFDSE